MTDNFDLIEKIAMVRESIVQLQRSKGEYDNQYKQMCTKNGIKQAKTLEDLEEPSWLKENSKVLGNVRKPVRTQDDETLFHLRNEREARRHRVEALHSNIEELMNEQMQLEQYINV